MSDDKITETKSPQLGKRIDDALETEERRHKVWQHYNLGNHNLSDIARKTNSHLQTVKRDIIVLQRRWALEEKNGKIQAKLKYSIALGYLADIQQMDEVIVKAIAAAEKSEDYSGLATLIDKKLKARRQLSELFHLVSNELQEVKVSATANATAVNAQYDLNGISDADIIAVSRKILSGGESKA